MSLPWRLVSEDGRSECARGIICASCIALKIGEGNFLLRQRDFIEPNQIPIRREGIISINIQASCAFYISPSSSTPMYAPCCRMFGHLLLELTQQILDRTITAYKAMKDSRKALVRLRKSNFVGGEDLDFVVDRKPRYPGLALLPQPTSSPKTSNQIIALPARMQEIFCPNLTTLPNVQPTKSNGAR